MKILGKMRRRKTAQHFSELLTERVRVIVCTEFRHFIPGAMYWQFFEEEPNKTRFVCQFASFHNEPDAVVRQIAVVDVDNDMIQHDWDHVGMRQIADHVVTQILLTGASEPMPDYITTGGAGNAGYAGIASALGGVGGAIAGASVASRTVGGAGLQQQLSPALWSQHILGQVKS
jgi:hypothetical protein